MVDSCSLTLDRLVATLLAARTELRASGTDFSEAARTLLGDGFALLGALYARLDTGRHPELAAHLDGLYEHCFCAIGEARPGGADRLEVVIALLTNLRRAQHDARAFRGQSRAPELTPA
jgi:flagellin-specific chaperone FliS